MTSGCSAQLRLGFAVAATGNLAIADLLAMTPEELAGLAVALLAGSELLSYIPGVKANGWLQLILAALRGIAAAAQAEQNNKKRRR